MCVGFESTEQGQEPGVFRRSLPRFCQEEVSRGGFFLQCLCCEGIYIVVFPVFTLCCILIVSLIDSGSDNLNSCN